MRLDYKKKDEQQSVSTVITTLALFIILLSFFIIMNSISTVEEQKVSSIMMSIEDAFTGRVLKNFEGPSERASPFKGTEEGRSNLKRLDALFRTEFPAIEDVQYNVNRGLFYAELPYEDFLAAIEAYNENEIPPPSTGRQANRFFEYITNLTNQTENPYRLELYVLSEDDPSSMIVTNRAELENMRRSAAIVAATLEDANVETKRLTIGLKQGTANNILLVVKNIVQENPADSSDWIRQ
ncbi:MAG: hypothetical protein CMH28_07990 [Micavibrio sp.]|nr:hypothetical protein [Micavibrio sp.]